MHCAGDKIKGTGPSAGAVGFTPIIFLRGRCFLLISPRGATSLLMSTDKCISQDQAPRAKRILGTQLPRGHDCHSLHEDRSCFILQTRNSTKAFTSLCLTIVFFAGGAIVNRWPMATAGNPINPFLHNRRRFGCGIAPGVSGAYGSHHLFAASQYPQPLRKANRSALILSACVVGMPCGKSLYVIRVPFFNSFADSGPAAT